ncbi:MAG: BamA/TamA family outer membrane protein [Myxococcales bacterium]|nr:BamA/TamA family outer membrane protein [Myxococcales bacterium]
MTATQTRRSASLVALSLGVVSPVPAYAEPDDAEPVQRQGEVRDEDRDEEDQAPPTPGATAPPKRTPTGRFQIGAGFSSDESFIAQATIAQDDLFRTGQRLSLTAQISAKRQLFLLGYDVPLGGGVELRTQLYAKDQLLPGFRRKAAGGTASLVAPFGEHLHGFVGFRLEQVEAEDTDDVIARTIALPGNDSITIASLRAGLAYSTLDDPLLPTTGRAFGASIELADPRWGSDVTLAKAQLWSSIHQPLGPAILHLSATGTAIASRDPGGVPRSERLFLESSALVRGYAPGSIGPANGGTLMYTVRAELEVPLIRSAGISAVTFLDGGGIFDRSGAGSAGVSYGFGLLWRSPIGPLRFDWGIPMDGGPARFVFGIGSGF